MPWNFGPWPQEQVGTLIDHYRCSLREDVVRELACRDATITFDQLVDLSIQLDNLLVTRFQHPQLRCQWSWEGLRSGRPEEGPSLAPSVAAEGTLPVVGASGSRGSRQGSLTSPHVSLHHSNPEPSVVHLFVHVFFP